MNKRDELIRDVSQHIDDIVLTSGSISHERFLTHVDAIINLCMDAAIEAAEKTGDEYYDAEYHKYPEMKSDAVTGINSAIDAIEKLKGDDK